MVSNINLRTMTSAQGLTIYGEFPKKETYVTVANTVSAFNVTSSGWSVSGAGDVNGDKYEDIILSAPYTTPKTQTYVIYGTKNSINIYLPSLTLEQGFSITGTGAYPQDHTGFSVSAAGDMNKDGYDDLVIAGNPTYVIFGKAIFTDNIDLVDFTASQGFRISVSGDCTRRE